MILLIGVEHVEGDMFVRVPSAEASFMKVSVIVFVGFLIVVLAHCDLLTFMNWCSTNFDSHPILTHPQLIM